MEKKREKHGAYDDFAELLQIVESKKYQTETVYLQTNSSNGHRHFNHYYLNNHRLTGTCFKLLPCMPLPWIDRSLLSTVTQTKHAPPAGRPATLLDVDPIEHTYAWETRTRHTRTS